MSIDDWGKLGIIIVLGGAFFLSIWTSIDQKEKINKLCYENQYDFCDEIVSQRRYRIKEQRDE